MSDRFTGELWHGIAGIYGAILAHPFLAGLTDGSLPQDTFAFYLVQDALYLQRYAEALAAVASRAPDTAGTEMFARHAAGAAVEHCASTASGAPLVTKIRPSGPSTSTEASWRS